MENKPIELRKDELAVLLFMRKHGQFVDFTVEKRPNAAYPDGELVRIIASQSVLVGNLTKTVL
jgi:hypothetical protein